MDANLRLERNVSNFMSLVGIKEDKSRCVPHLLNFFEAGGGYVMADQGVLFCYSDDKLVDTLSFKQSHGLDLIHRFDGKCFFQIDRGYYMKSDETEAYLRSTGNEAEDARRRAESVDYSGGGGGNNNNNNNNNG